MQVTDKPGSLAQYLQIMAKHGVNITRIESRPDRASFDTTAFHIDFEGLLGDGGPVDDMMVELKLESLSVRYSALGRAQRLRCRAR